MILIAQKLPLVHVGIQYQKLDHDDCDELNQYQLEKVKFKNNIDPYCVIKNALYSTIMSYSS